MTGLNTPQHHEVLPTVAKKHTDFGNLRQAEQAYMKNTRQAEQGGGKISLIFSKGFSVRDVQYVIFSKGFSVRDFQ